MKEIPVIVSVWEITGKGHAVLCLVVEMYILIGMRIMQVHPTVKTHPSVY